MCNIIWRVAAIGNWKNIIQEQLSLLKKVGLTQHLIVSFVGSSIDYSWFLVQCIDNEIVPKKLLQNENILIYEYMAIKYIEHISKTLDSNILYFHTKGASDPSNQNKIKWRKLMESYVIEDWKTNIQYLEKYYDAVGVNWVNCGNPHFSGNFWIATTQYIRTLPDFTEYARKMNNRFACEFWIGSNPNIRYKSLFCENKDFMRGEGLEA